MLKRPDWLRIQEESPQALADCRAYFERHFPMTWREAIREAEHLRAYFHSHELRIQVGERVGAYFFELRLPWGRLAKDGWKDATEARREAFVAAFRELEIILVHRRGGRRAGGG